MNHYTPEYKEVIRNTSKMYGDGIISFNTLCSILGDVERVMGVEVEVAKKDIILYADICEEYEVVG